jgi:hypothetical protein
MGKLLLSNIHPDPARRHTISDTIRVFNQFLYSEKMDKPVVFEEIVARINNSKYMINRMITLDQRKMKTLVSKTARQSV